MSADSFTGKLCPYCQAEFKENSETVECSKCGEFHHVSCWSKNGGCSTFGCDGQPVVQRSASDWAPDKKKGEEMDPGGTDEGVNDELSIPEKIIGVFISPAKTFTYLGFRPDFWTPFIVISLILIAVSMLAVPPQIPLVEEMTINQMMSDPNMANLPQTEKDAILTGTSTGIRMVVYAQATIGVPIGMIIGWLLFSALAFFTSMIQGLDTDFKRLFGIIPWVSFITMLSQISRLVVMMTYDFTSGEQLQNLRIVAPLSLIQLIPESAGLPAFLETIAGVIDPFFIWGTIVTVFALQAANRCKRSQAITTTIIITLISLVVVGALGLLQGLQVQAS